MISVAKQNFIMQEKEPDSSFWMIFDLLTSKKPSRTSAMRFSDQTRFSRMSMEYQCNSQSKFSFSRISWGNPISSSACIQEIIVNFICTVVKLWIRWRRHMHCTIWMCNVFSLRKKSYSFQCEYALILIRNKNTRDIQPLVFWERRDIS